MAKKLLNLCLKSSKFALSNENEVMMNGQLHEHSKITVLLSYTFYNIKTKTIIGPEFWITFLKVDSL